MPDEMLTDPAFWGAVVAAVASVVIGYSKRFGGERFVWLRRFIDAIRGGGSGPPAFVAVVIGLKLMLGGPGVALADGGIIRDGSLDLRVLKLGQTIAVDVAFAGAGVRILPPERLPQTVVDLQPVYIDPALGSCKLWDGLPWCGLLGGTSTPP